MTLFVIFFNNCMSFASYTFTFKFRVWRLFWCISRKQTFSAKKIKNVKKCVFNLLEAIIVTAKYQKCVQWGWRNWVGVWLGLAGGLFACAEGAGRGPALWGGCLRRWAAYRAGITFSLALGQGNPLGACGLLWATPTMATGSGGGR